MLTCKFCEGRFSRPGARGPVPQFCSTRCKSKRDRQRPERIVYERLYRRQRRARGLDLTDNVARRDYYRERWRRLYGDPHPGFVIPQPYTGHRWFDMAKQAVNGGRDVDPAFRDFGYDDEMGEAVLALLEGRDMGEAVREFRRKEFVPRHLTLFLGDWHNKDEGIDWVEEALPPVPSAEEEVMAGFAVATRYIHGTNDRPTNKSRKSKTQPSRRRQKDGKGWQKHAA